MQHLKSTKYVHSYFEFSTNQKHSIVTFRRDVWLANSRRFESSTLGESAASDDKQNDFVGREVEYTYNHGGTQTVQVETNEGQPPTEVPTLPTVFHQVKASEKKSTYKN